MADALESQRFMSGLRQKWCAIFVICAFIVMIATITYNIDPSPFMNFFLAIGTTFILGESVTSFAKTHSVGSIRKIEKRGEIEQMRIREQKLASQKEIEEQNERIKVYNG
jgi:hypothetical protein